MTRELLVAGAGIGGLCAALAARAAGWEARVFEQSPEFSEVGAGLQLGPNALRVLRAWQAVPQESLALPRALRVRDATDGRELAHLPLDDFEARYGEPYATAHRADLHGALLRAAQARGVRLHAARRVEGIDETPEAAVLRCDAGEAVEGDALVGADGLWSRVRARVAGDAPPRPTGHLAYRALVRQADLPPAQRSADVTAWLGPRMHLVTYPVRRGDWLNAVCVVHGTIAGDPRGWDHDATAARLHAALGPLGGAARDCIGAMPAWRLWVLHDRPPLAGPQEMHAGRVALLGDAAHPMRPYLAQGAGMAIEDAGALGRALAMVADGVADVPLALRRYALERWQRVARVQARSLRNGTVFHATGALRLARNTALRVMGARLLDQPWLYRG